MFLVLWDKRWDIIIYEGTDRYHVEVCAHQFWTFVQMIAIVNNSPSSTSCTINILYTFLKITPKLFRIPLPYWPQMSPTLVISCPARCPSWSKFQVTASVFQRSRGNKCHREKDRSLGFPMMAVTGVSSIKVKPIFPFLFDACTYCICKMRACLFYWIE